MNKVTKIVLTAMFAALCCVATMIIKVPTIGTNGYVNIGDTIVLIGAWILGTMCAGENKDKLFDAGILYAAAAGGIGSMLADVISGYASYAPGTFVIKALMAAVAVISYKLLIRVNKHSSYILSGILAEIVMVSGYFLYESTLLGYGLAAAASIPSNAIQGITCLILGVVLASVLDGSRALKSVLASSRR